MCPNKAEAAAMFGKKFYAFFFLVLSCSAAPSFLGAGIDYPNCKDNPYLNDQMQYKIAPYLLPIGHPVKPVLDRIFSRSRVLENERTLVDAGFEIISGPRVRSFVIVARHPEVPGYVFKLHLDSESRCRKEVPHWLWLVRRCIGAKGIRKIIKRENITNFVVPDKWLYVLPVYPFSSALNPEPLILIETDMELESKEVTIEKWKTVVTRKHLDELYLILKHGHGGHGLLKLPSNVPYTKHGKFAFTDTEDLKADLKLEYIKRYLSKDMQRYWDKLIKK